jgi:hypothetical protein
MDKKELTQEQQEYLAAQRERGLAFDEMVRTKGYEMLKNLITQRTTAFSVEVLNGQFKNMEELNLERGMVLGMNTIIRTIENDMESVREASTPSAK